MTGPIRYEPNSEQAGMKTLPAPLRILAILGLTIVGVGVIALVAQGISKATSSAVEVTLPAGTTFVAALDQTVSTEKADVGDRVALVTTEPLDAGDGVVFPKGLMVQGEVTHAKDGGRVAGAPELTIRFTSLEVEGKSYRISAEPMRLKGKDDKGESAKQIGGGTVAGVVVGAVTGNVVRGAILGAAAGTALAVATDGEHIVLPVGQKLRVQLAEDLQLKYEPKEGPDQQ